GRPLSAFSHFSILPSEWMDLRLLLCLLLLSLTAVASLPLVQLEDEDDGGDNPRAYLVITSEGEDDLTPDKIRRDDVLEMLGAREESMGKRSLTGGRLGFRPGKRSLALGRTHFRPGKRSIALGRMGFRPGKRSLALGRNGFRPGKRMVPLQSMDADYY
ncbi:hypothetical protein PENTCL1PPCAC_26351, partial [Pristionchus entomophagus]